MTSLGLNQHKPQRYTNLAGSAGGNFTSVRRTAAARRSPPLRPAPPRSPSTLKEEAEITPQSVAQRMRTLMSIRARAAGVASSPPTPRAAAAAAAPRPAAAAAPRPAAAAAAPPAAAAAAAEAAHHSAQWVFGTAAADLVDDDAPGEVVAAAGDRVLLVYPMAQDAETGRVTMRLKRVDPVTAALSYATVAVYDPDATPARRVVEYALAA